MPAPIKYSGKICKCTGCKYFYNITKASALYCCHYLLETGKVRGIAPIDCYKHENTPYTPKKRGVTNGNSKRMPLYKRLP